MLTTWSFRVFALSFLLLAVLKGHEVSHLRVFRKLSPAFSLPQFRKVEKIISKDKLQLLYLWESMLTGKSRRLSSENKSKFQSLGLSHLFTPSGFHLSAATLPLQRFLKTYKFKLLFLCLLTFLAFQLSGFGALKRMTLVKLGQHTLGHKVGFTFAMLFDVLLGSFIQAPLSFTLSFLFLGIIYSGASRLMTIMMFFLAQCLIAYFMNQPLSIWLLIFNPLLNICFGFIFPALILLAYPLREWQLSIGLTLLELVKVAIDFAFLVQQSMPALEMTILLIMFPLIPRKFLPIVLILLSASLNQNHSLVPSPARFDFRPLGSHMKVVSDFEKDVIYMSDGKCERRLIEGFWWEKCSPRRGSKKKN